MKAVVAILPFYVAFFGVAGWSQLSPELAREFCKIAAAREGSRP